MPLDLKYTPAVPTGRVVVHAGKLVDMKAPTTRTNVDIIIDGNRITSVVPHADATTRAARWSTRRTSPSCPG